MESEKSKIAAKIRALLDKTIENGCSEAEALVAVEKATELMRKHQITMTEAEIVAEGFERAKVNWKDRKSTLVRDLLCAAVSEYTDTRVWRTTGLNKVRTVIVFFGLQSDVTYASWLLEALTDFVIRQAEDFIDREVKNLAEEFGCSEAVVRRTRKGRLDSNHTGFMIGCARRLNARLRAERPQQQVKSATGNALVVIDKRRLVNDALKAEGVRLRSGSSRSISMGSASGYAAGTAAANSANFNRGVGDNGAAHRFISKQ